MIGLGMPEMKTISSLKKYDLIDLQLTQGLIEDCLIYQVSKRGIHIYPVGKAISDEINSRAIAKIFIPKAHIINFEYKKPNRLLYAVNNKNSFLLEAMKFHMNK